MKIWFIATSEHLKFVYLAFTEPQKRHSFIVSVALSNKERG
jgi:hypothetical protein